MLRTRQRLWCASMLIALIAACCDLTSVLPSAAAESRIKLTSLGIAANGAGLVVSGTFDCVGNGNPFGVVSVAQNVGSGHIQSQFNYLAFPRCSPGKRLPFAAALPPPTPDDNPGDPQFVDNLPWRAAPLTLSISVGRNGLSRIATPTVATFSSTAIRPAGRIIAKGAAAGIGLALSCRSRQTPPPSDFEIVQLTQVIRGVAQTVSVDVDVVCDGQVHHFPLIMPSQTPWRSGPAFVAVDGGLTAFADVRLRS